MSSSAYWRSKYAAAHKYRVTSWPPPHWGEAAGAGAEAGEPGCVLVQVEVPPDPDAGGAGVWKVDGAEGRRGGAAGCPATVPVPLPAFRDVPHALQRVAHVPVSCPHPGHLPEVVMAPPFSAS
ncbi:hypothetical protein [Streptomyces broussonetiae]|uniref:Uncharacterized protein n=1 Tax=Streptomyces broussonetiae TaxID=2686304 RepID=A0A6I6N9B9_9ACTN|nr:hypothetical protein [Streptomyces broussonetiae]QHA05525.1 hypothetical protein GQF42_21460 [Streptomyces broussonetiae]